MYSVHIMTSIGDLPVELIEQIALCSARSLNVFLQVHRKFYERSQKPGMKKLYCDAVTCIKTSRSAVSRTVAGRRHAFDQPAVTYIIKRCTNGPKRKRAGGPPYLNTKGREEWYYNGQRHRSDDLPAITTFDGTTTWYSHDKRHRVGGPAIITSEGAREWYQRGKLHRLDGPAAIASDGCKEWYRNGKRHRIGGPAFESDGDEDEYWEYGVRILS